MSTLSQQRGNLTRRAPFPLRAYTHNSPEAKARLIVLTLLADGRLDRREMECLDKHGIYATLGLDREAFVRVLREFCSDVACLPKQSGSYCLAQSTLAALFAEVDQSDDRRALMRHLFEIISCDGHLADAEAKLFWSAADAWHLRLSEIAPATSPPATKSPASRHRNGSDRDHSPASDVRS